MVLFTADFEVTTVLGTFTVTDADTTGALTFVVVSITRAVFVNTVPFGVLTAALTEYVIVGKVTVAKPLSGLAKVPVTGVFDVNMTVCPPPPGHTPAVPDTVYAQFAATDSGTDKFSTHAGNWSTTDAIRGAASIEPVCSEALIVNVTGTPGAAEVVDAVFGAVGVGFLIT